jgi:hypothetical protein
VHGGMIRDSARTNCKTQPWVLIQSCDPEAVVSFGCVEDGSDQNIAEFQIWPETGQLKEDPSGSAYFNLDLLL